MDRSYLQGFTDQQLLHYQTTLKRRIKDLRQLTIELVSENQELGHVYEELIHQKTHIYHQNQKKKKSWGNWLNKSKQKIGNLLHITKKPEENGNKNEQKGEEIPEQREQPYVLPDTEEVKREETPPKNKVLDILEKGKQKITKLFSSNKNTNEQQAKFDIQYAVPVKKFGYLSELVKENTVNPQSRYAEILQKMGNQNIKIENSPMIKETPREEIVNEGELDKRQLSSFEKITKHELHQSESKQNCTVKIQSAAFQPQEVQVSPQNQEKLEVSKQKIPNLTEQKHEEVKEEKTEKELSHVQEEQVKENNDNEDNLQKEVVEIGAAEQVEENEYAVHYESMNNYQLEEGALSQIVEKYAPSHEETKPLNITEIVEPVESQQNGEEGNPLSPEGEQPKQ